MYCEKCGAPLASGEKFCTRCGAPVETPKVDLKKETKPKQSADFGGYCDGCGAELPPEAHYCPKCGRQTPLGDQLNGSVEPQGSPPVPPQRPKWVIPTIAVSAAGIVLAFVFGAQALSGGWFSSGKNMVLPAAAATASASKSVPSSPAFSIFSARPTTSPTPLASATPRKTQIPAATTAAVPAGTTHRPATFAGPTASSVPRTAAGQPGATFTLTEAQSQALIDEVAGPLMFAYVEPGYPDTLPESGDPAVYGESFWWNYLSDLLSQPSSQPSLQNRAGSENLQYYSWELGDETPYYAPVSVLNEYMNDAYGTDYMLTASGVLDPGGEAFSFMPGDPGSSASVDPVDLPLAVTNGKLRLTAQAGPQDSEEPGYYDIVLTVSQAPASRYGCYITNAEFIETVVPTEVTPAPGAIAAPAAPRGFDANGFVFADSSERYLTPEELQGLSKEMLAFARNEIFARNGNLFRTDKYINHYTQYAWYNNMPGKRHDIIPEDLNEIEQANIRLIQSFE